jgi:hypothetical protein
MNRLNIYIIILGFGGQMQFVFVPGVIEIMTQGFRQTLFKGGSTQMLSKLKKDNPSLILNR